MALDYAEVWLYNIAGKCLAAQCKSAWALCGGPTETTPSTASPPGASPGYPGKTRKVPSWIQGSACGVDSLLPLPGFWGLNWGQQACGESTIFTSWDISPAKGPQLFAWFSINLKYSEKLRLFLCFFFFLIVFSSQDLTQSRVALTFLCPKCSLNFSSLYIYLPTPELVDPHSHTWLYAILGIFPRVHVC